jgi:hypothetical protein
MRLDITARTRLLALVGVIVAAAGAAAMLMLSGSHNSTGRAALPPSLLNRPANASRTPGPTNPATASDLPASISSQLSAGRVVVVSLYTPKAAIDATAMKEAAAGAAIANAAFLAVDVNGSDVDALNRRYGVIQDPAVLVLRPPGDLIVRIDGFADRDTVAQAAANAAS